MSEPLSSTKQYPTDFCPWCGAHAGSTTFCTNCGESLGDRRVGSVVGERYRIDSLLAQGGMGRVYLGTHLTLGSEVVVKFLLSEVASRPEARARFRREAVVLGSLRHPGIVSVFDFGEENGTPYLVMERIRGRGLDELIRADGQVLPLPRIGVIFDQLFEVLEVAHAAGVVHRDLKPENVMLLDTQGGIDRIKVLDFGLALVAEGPESQRLTTTGTFQGTPLYMSPEQCHNRDIGPPSDVYSAGVMLYEAITGETPFSGDSGPTLMAKHIFTSPPRLAERGVKREVPPGLEALVMRALAKEAPRRPSTSELRAELALAIRGEDPVSVAARAAADKARSATRGRDERSLPKVGENERLTSPARTGAVSQSSFSPLVVLWGLSGPRAEALRDALGVNGVFAISWPRDRSPPVEEGGRALRAVIVDGGAAPGAAITALRGEAAVGKVPILVLDLPTGDELPALIRAGASDAVLKGSEDGAVCKQVLRLIRRGR